MASKKAPAKKAPAKKVTPKPSANAVKPTVTGGAPPPAPNFPPPPVIDDDTASRVAAIDAIASQYNTKDKLLVARADEVPNPYILRRPTGIMELDIQLGGGFPAGGACFIGGPDNAGKTWLMLRTMAMQQRLYGERCVLAYAITEGSFPYDQAARVGLRVAIPNDMIRMWQEIRTQRGEPPYTDADINFWKKETGHFRIIRGETGEETLNVLLKIIATKACQIVACDSLHGLQSCADADKDLEDTEKRAAHATMIGKFFKKYVPLTLGLQGTNYTTLLATQQVRSNNAKSSAPAHLQQYLKDWEVKGSYAAKHYKLIDLTLSDGQVLKKGDGAARKAFGKVVKWEFEKGKAGCHDNQTGEVQFIYDLPGHVDYAGTVIESALARGVLRQIGKQHVIVRPNTGEVLDNLGFPSLKALKTVIEQDTGIETTIRMEILAAAGIQCLYQ
jgi:RecA/RadA recombinase